MVEESAGRDTDKGAFRRSAARPTRFSCALPCRLGAGVGVRLRENGRNVPRTAAWGGVDVYIRVRQWSRADEQCCGACLASWGAMAENESWSQKRGGIRISGVHLVGGGDMPAAGSGCVGFPDRMHG